jgi:hypothetical protein
MYFVLDMDRYEFLVYLDVEASVLTHPFCVILSLCKSFPYRVYGTKPVEYFVEGESHIVMIKDNHSLSNIIDKVKSI